MMRGLWSGVSGLQVHQVKMDVIGDNIANINTTGFKRSDVVFTDFMSELRQIAHGPQGDQGGTGPQQIGLGVSIGSMTRDHSQGAMQRTDRTLDCAVQGSGFFVVRDGDALYYTRNGSFQLDARGTLVYSNGMKIQGWQAEIDPVTGEYVINSSTKPIDDIQIKVGDIIPAKATTSVELIGNLNSVNKMAMEPVLVEWITGGEGAYTVSKIKMEFEHISPNENYYIWRAVWADNPPAGYKIGDAVIDSNTGYQAEGIIELDSTGKVIGNSINTNRPWVANASVPVSASNNKGNISLAKLDVRNQYNVESALWQVRFDQSDTTKYTLWISTDNGSNWNLIGDDAGESVKDAHNNDVAAGVASVNTNTVFTYVTGSDAANRKMYGQLTLLASDWNGTAQRGDIITFQTGKSDTIADYAQMLNLRTEFPKEEDDWPVMVASKPVASNTNSLNSGLLHAVSVNRSVKLVQPATVNEESVGAGNSGIAFRTKAGAGAISIEFSDTADNPPTINIAGGVITVGITAGVTTAQQVINAINGNVNSRALVSAYTATGSDGTGTVAAMAAELIDAQSVFEGSTLTTPYFDFSSDKVAVDGYVLPAVTYRIQIPSDYDYNTKPYFNIVNTNGVIIATGNVKEDFNSLGIYIKREAWLDPANMPAGKYVDFTTTQINPQPANYRVVFTGATTYNLEKYDTATSSWINVVVGQDIQNDLDLENNITTAGADNYTDPLDVNYNTALANETIKIPWTNWSGPFTANDTYYFDTHKSVSEEPGHRDFIRVKDAGGRITEIFLPSGSLTGADPITFQPNTSELSTAADTSFASAYNAGDTRVGMAVSGAPVTAVMNNKNDYQFVTNINVYDSLGRAHNIPITFERKSDNLWMWSVKDPDPKDPQNVLLAGYGLIGFKADGSYDPASSVTFNSQVALSAGGVTGPIVYPGIYFDPSDWGGAPIPPEGANPVMIMPDFAQLVQYASANDAELYSQNGYAKGTLTEFSVNAFGVITGLYDNGHSRDIAQIALANFNNEAGLLKGGNSLYRTTSNSGEARIGVAGTGGRGAVASGNLEQSNVDLAYEFTTMITTQRGFQANSRTITTEDQMIQELLGLKR